MTKNIRVTCTIDFDLIEGDPDSLTEDQQFLALEEIMAALPQKPVAVGTDAFAFMEFDPVGWRVSHDTWGDLSVNCPTHLVQDSPKPQTTTLFDQEQP